MIFDLENQALSKVIYTKCSNESCIFSFRFCADGSVIGSTENSAILLKYPTFEGIFSSIQEQKKKRLRVSVHCSVGTKKLMKIDLKELSICASKYTF